MLTSLCIELELGKKRTSENGTYGISIKYEDIVFQQIVFWFGVGALTLDLGVDDGVGIETRACIEARTGLDSGTGHVKYLKAK